MAKGNETRKLTLPSSRPLPACGLQRRLKANVSHQFIVTSDTALRIIGGLCIAIGLASVIWGGKRLPEAGPISSRIAPLDRAFRKYKWLKWAVGGSFVYAGIAILLRS